jgi:hypothetical protein
VTYFVRAITYHNTAFAHFCHVLGVTSLPQNQIENDVGMGGKNYRQLKRPDKSNKEIMHGIGSE